MSVFTKKAIQAAFLSLLQQMPLDKITVKMIVDACGVSRNTFYYHYEDINALLKDLLETETARIQAEVQSDGSWQELLSRVLTSIAAHRKAFYHVYRSADRNQLHAHLWTTINALTAQAVDEAAAGRPLQPEDRKSISVFFSSAFLGICEQWLEDGMEEPPETMAKRLAPFSGLLEETVRRFLESGH